MHRDVQTLVWLVNGLVAWPAKARKRPRAYYTWQGWQHLAEVGSRSLAIVSIIAACTGMILALQAAQQLEKVGALSYVANMVSVTIVKELGPLLTAIILAGRSGAAFCAEIATMQISEEIDALQVIGIDPVRFLVAPKIMAMLIMLPVLTLWADLVGILAGGLFSSLLLGLSLQGYLNQAVLFLGTNDVVASVVKAAGFGGAITVICCWQGFLAREGAADVGRRTTKAVVQSIFMIILLDFFFTALNYIAG
ncbi:ABC transporter permease [Oleidesulfovibrio sp.]|uniref:ABC transporter permease n=1 Tax=Oleidesulfovibrio sp. TaxID=2909707 RepID=UPI003A876411